MRHTSSNNTNNPLQTSFADLDQMSLFADCLPDTQPKLGLEEILASGNVSSLGSFIKEITHKELRVELLHCGFQIPEKTSKSDLIDRYWSGIILKLKANHQALC